MQKSDIKPQFGKGGEFVTYKTSHENIDDKTVYQLASVSKSYTGVLANLMALDGRFGEAGLNANLVQLFEACDTEEAMQIAKDKGFENITIEKVLNHTSGIGIINYKSIATSKERSEKIIAGERAMSDIQFLQEELPEKGKHWKEPFGYANEGFFLFFANKIPELYSNPQIAKQLYNASFNQGLCEDENGKDIPNTASLYSCGMYIRLTKLQNGNIKVDFRHAGQFFGGFQTQMNASCEYDFKGTAEEFIEVMKSGQKQIDYKPLQQETNARYEKYDGLAQEMLLDSIVGDYHTKLLYEIGSKTVQDGKITQEQFDEVCQSNTVIAIFDFDVEGWNQFNGLRNYSAWDGNNTITKHNSSNTFAFLLPVPDNRKSDASEELQDRSYMPIEFLFKDDKIQGICIEEKYRGNITLKRIKDNNKTTFAENTKNFTVEGFENFKAIFELITKIITPTAQL